MMRRCFVLKNLSFRSFLFLIIVITVVINEFLVHRIQSWRWPSLPEGNRNPEDEMRVMFVSDPQIIGYQDEHTFPLGAITRWDSDKFLQRTFSLAFSYVEPDVIVFLGDLMDEGSKATYTEYETSLDRIESILYPARNTRKVFLPGDNDIGGEGRDFRTPFKMNRFEQTFENITGVEREGFIDFIKLDLRLHRDMPATHRQVIQELKGDFTSPLRVIVNHETMLPKLKTFIYPILMEIQPHLLVSGHWHESRHFVCEDCLSDNADVSFWPVHQRDLTDIDSFIDIDLNKHLDVHELMVPTCSYRMGEDNMGYGVAILDPEGHLKYTVLWLPNRYTQLYAYIVVLVIVIVLFVTCFLIQCLQPQRPPQYRYYR